MSEPRDAYDVVIVGGGPAGLSAAVVLGRSRRSVLVIDHGKPRNYAARSVNGYLGVMDLSPADFRASGRRQAEAFDVEFLDDEVDDARCGNGARSPFRLSLLTGRRIEARKLLLATGVRDSLPDIENIDALYGSMVHHCPYCDGWEHRDERLLALAEGKAAVTLALTLFGWSHQVTACSGGVQLSASDRESLTRNRIAYRAERPVRLIANAGRLVQVEFETGPPLACDAVFFSDDQSQRSRLPGILGCECDEHGLIRTTDRDGTGIPGLFLAGDAGKDVQFAIVAAAEGATAAQAINKELLEEDFGCAE